MKTPEMEIAITNPTFGAFPFTRYFVLPRASWGLKGIDHECDLLALSNRGVLHEIEIKVSKSDILADKRKRHTHHSPIIKRLWFAVPNEIKDFAIQHIPQDAGLISVSQNKTLSGKIREKCTIERTPKHRGKEKPSEEFIKHMYELMAMRYWSEKARSLKKKVF